MGNLYKNGLYGGGGKLRMWKLKTLIIWNNSKSKKNKRVEVNWCVVRRFLAKPKRVWQRNYQTQLGISVDRKLRIGMGFDCWTLERSYVVMVGSLMFLLTKFAPQKKCWQNCGEIYIRCTKLGNRLYNRRSIDFLTKDYIIEGRDLSPCSQVPHLQRKKSKIVS